jgi:hypothetical protein
MDTESLKNSYKDYLHYCKNNTWNWDMITNHLKKTEGRVENYYSEFSFEEFVKKCKADESFSVRWFKK